MRRIILGVAALVIALIGAGLYFGRDALAVRLFTHAVDEGVGASTFTQLPDGLSAAFCGTGSPLPDRTRAGPCTAVIAGPHMFVFDAGEDAAETLNLMGLSPARIEAVFLTHFHSDHIDGLGALALQRWAGGSAHTQLPVYGGEGVAHVTGGFNEAYLLDSGYRVAHHGPEVVPPEGFGMAPHAFTIPDGQERLVVYDQDGVRITAFRVDHGPVHPAVGYRVDYKTRSIVISGDTAPSPSLERAAQGADLLVHEGLQPRLVAIMGEAATTSHQPGIAKIMHDIPGYHTAPETAADIAQRAHVGALAFTHIIPPLPIGILEGPFLGDARRRFSGPLWVMRDGDIIALPAAGGMTRLHVLR